MSKWLRLQVLFRFVAKPFFFWMIEQRKAWSMDLYESKVDRACTSCFKFFYHAVMFAVWHNNLERVSWGTLPSILYPFDSPTLNPEELWRDRRDIPETIKWYHYLGLEWRVVAATQWIISMSLDQHVDLSECDITSGGILSHVDIFARSSLSWFQSARDLIFWRWQFTTLSQLD